MHFADALPDEPQGETNCCGFNVSHDVLQVDCLIMRVNAFSVC